MLHEFKRIVAKAIIHQGKGTKCLLVTMVDLEGSSYRKPGVRMLIADTGEMTGAISGGCVEKEILRRSQSVFADGLSKVVTYDGRFRLGCEGLLFILIEPFIVSTKLFDAFSSAIEKRQQLQMSSRFEAADEAKGYFGTTIEFENGEEFTFSSSEKNHVGDQLFSQNLKPCFRLLIVGSEHDAIQLCLFASLLGWEVEVQSISQEEKTQRDFPGAQKVSAASIDTFTIDEQTAVILMTHHYASDLKALIALQERNAIYVGVLGSENRHESLQRDLSNSEYFTHRNFSNSIFSPTGLDIGAITPGEIAISILAEITSVVREKSSRKKSKIGG